MWPDEVPNTAGGHGRYTAWFGSGVAGVPPMEACMVRQSCSKVGTAGKGSKGPFKSGGEFDSCGERPYEVRRQPVELVAHPSSNTAPSY